MPVNVDLLLWSGAIIRGERGQAGPAGATGPQGADGTGTDSGGNQGPQGPSGSNGSVGPTGPQGKQGRIGIIGPQGPRGVDGQVGPQGPPSAPSQLFYPSNTAFNIDPEPSYINGNASPLNTTILKMNVNPASTNPGSIIPQLINAGIGSSIVITPTDHSWVITYSTSDPVVYNDVTGLVTVPVAMAYSYAPDTPAWTVDALEVEVQRIGQSGAIGEVGARGDQGVQGPEGQIGETGPQGHIGVQGEKGINYRGAWSSSVAYTQRDSVSLDGSSYIAVQSNNAKQPPNPVYWDVIATAGLQGPQGSYPSPLTGTSNGSFTIGDYPVTISQENEPTIDRPMVSSGDGFYSTYGFFGSGSRLTGLNASNISSGTINDSHLGSNIARTNTSLSISGNISATGFISNNSMTINNQTFRPKSTGSLYARFIPNGDNRSIIQTFNTDYATDTTNYESLEMGYDTYRNYAYIGSASGGTGVARNLQLKVGQRTGMEITGDGKIGFHGFTPSVQPVINISTDPDTEFGDAYTYNMLISLIRKLRTTGIIEFEE